MVGLRKRGEQIRQFILDNVEEHASDIVSFTSSELGISRQAVNKHIQHLVRQEMLTAEGTTRSRKYTLRHALKHFIYPLQGLQEHLVWRNDIAPLFSDLHDNVRGIWQYGFTEMLNNAIEHSSGTRVRVEFITTAITSQIIIIDDGEGIFKKIQRELGLDDERHAVLELAKGKLTTDPAHHTGEGIFFSSRMFDHFGIASGNTGFSHMYRMDEDMILEVSGLPSGTMVSMRLDNNSAKTTKEIFDRFTTGDDYGFTKTVVPVRLAQYGDEKLISRSQAKRLLARFDRFKTVVLDFEHVESIGQAFADEVFRVFVLEHPQITIVEKNTNPIVQQMINRARHRD